MSNTDLTSTPQDHAAELDRRSREPDCSGSTRAAQPPETYLGLSGQSVIFTERDGEGEITRQIKIDRIFDDGHALQTTTRFVTYDAETGQAAHVEREMPVDEAREFIDRGEAEGALTKGAMDVEVDAYDRALGEGRR